MSLRALAITALLPFIFLSCSGISKKDCSKDMKEFGFSQGKAGSPKKYTDDLRNKCMASNPGIDLEGYEKGFYQGWMEYCLPNKAFEMGKRADRYFSFCPPERESSFREKYLVGKHYAELKEWEADIITKLEELKPSISESSSNMDEYRKIEKELEKARRDLQALEVEGAKNNFKFR